MEDQELPNQNQTPQINDGAVSPEQPVMTGGERVMQPLVNDNSGSFQAAAPQTNRSDSMPTTSQTSQPPREGIVKQDTGYLENLLQKSASARRVTLTLYISHLKIEDASTGELLEDVPIEQIRKTSRYIPNRFYWSLYTVFSSSLLLIKTQHNHYRMSWVDRDAEAVMIGGPVAGIAGAQQNYTKNMQWVKAIHDLQNGQTPQIISYDTPTSLQTQPGFMGNAASHFDTPNKPLGYFLIFFPLTLLLICAAVFGYTFLIAHSHEGYGFLALIVGTVIVLPLLCFGLIFGLRKSR